MQKATELNLLMHRILWILLFFVYTVGYSQTSSQMVLSYPPDAAQLNTYLPNFIWNSSLAGDFQYSYNIHIAHLDSGQTYQDAILYNPPLVYQQNLSTTTFQYPLSAFPLEDSNRYVWQIETAINGNIASYSDIWMFYYQSKKHVKADTPRVSDYSYPNLQLRLNSAFYFFDKVISFKYNNESGDSILNIRIHESGSIESLDGVTPSPEVLKPYENYIIIPVNGLYKKNRPYILEEKNSRNELWQMKFIVH